MFFFWKLVIEHTKDYVANFTSDSQVSSTKGHFQWYTKDHRRLEDWPH